MRAATLQLLQIAAWGPSVIHICAVTCSTDAWER